MKARGGGPPRGRERRKGERGPHKKTPARKGSGGSRHETETSACRGEWRREAHRPRKRARPSVCHRERARGERPPPKIGLGAFKKLRGLFYCPDGPDGG